MTERVLEPENWEATSPVVDVEHLITEDDTPVDNLPSEKQQRLLVEPLYTSWQTDKPFLAAANVGVFLSTHRQPLVPDMLLSLEVEVAENWWAKEHRSYFVWEFGKLPDVVIEIVSNTKGHELTSKLQEYKRMGVSYYVVYDPQHLLQAQTLHVYVKNGGEYTLAPNWLLPEVGLALTLWAGEFEGKQTEWLRWQLPNGELLLTGAEKALLEQQRAEQERERANQEHQRAERLAAQLRALGIEPEA